MAILPIRIYDDPILTREARPIEKVLPHHRRLAEDMAETMYEANGIGLAAVQVGVLERLAVIDVEWARAEKDSKPQQKPIFMINPEIVQESIEDEAYNEGCLSLPDVEAEVWRSETITVHYSRLDGKQVEKECVGLEGRVIQHEIDHLNGVLFIDRLSESNRRSLTVALKKLAKSQRDAEDRGREVVLGARSSARGS